MGIQNTNNSAIDYKLINEYFKPESVLLSVLLTLLTFVSLLIWLCCILAGSIGWMVFFLLLSLLFIWLESRRIKKKTEKTLADEIVDNAIKSQLTLLKERAFNKLGIDEEEVKEIPPIIFHNYDYSFLSNTLNGAIAGTAATGSVEGAIAGAVISAADSKFKFKFGKDNKLRTNQYRVVMFFFSSDEVYCYVNNFSLTEDSQKESTHTYFYKDIVSVTTETQTALVGLRKYNYIDFKLMTTGGTSISCSVREDKVEDAQRSIKGMRSLIKEKKQA